MSNSPKIIYTKTDEAPALATYSFLPIIQTFTAPAHVHLESRDISLAARILSLFPDYLAENQRVSDDLAELGELAKTPEANIIKLPNISASIPQLKAAVTELQNKGFAIPDYPDNPTTDKEKEVRSRYDKVKGSAVNPVLREGNSDRRAPQAVKNYAKKHPHRMGEWSSDSKSHVSTMTQGDFFHNEKSLTLDADNTLSIVLTKKDGEKITLKENLKVLKDEIIDGTFMSKNALVSFLDEQIQDAKDKKVLFSIHLKATMMKVSDPIMFGYAVKVYFRDLFSKYQETFEKLEVDANDGLGTLEKKLSELPKAEKDAILADISKTIAEGPAIAMVDSDKGITNLHVPSDVIVDASMPAMIRTSGQMWGTDGKTHDAKAVIPDSSYAGVFQKTIEFCKKHGAFDPATMGSVPNVGLMAQKAEEYGSHDKTFEIPADGKVEVLENTGKVIMTHEVEKGDIWRMCQAKDLPIQDWIKLAVNRARATNDPTIFWLDKNRAHDQELIKKVNKYLPEHNTDGLEIKILAPDDATDYTLERVKAGKNTISVTGNVLRDYLTDLFPILELGTSAKMLSIVPLMDGGGLFETGAGGSAPKHVQQFMEDDHLRWDSLGEFLALAVSLEHLGRNYDNPEAIILSECLDKATEEYLNNSKSPSRYVNELDTRGGHFYLAMYWAQALAEQNQDTRLKEVYTPLAKAMTENEEKIVEELNTAQGKKVDMGGYYMPDDQKIFNVMRSSKTLNKVLADFSAQN